MSQSGNVRCPRCGNPSPRAIRKADPIDPFIRSLSGWMYQLLGGRIYHCRQCRVQFYASRSKKSAGSKPA